MSNPVFFRGWHSQCVNAMFIRSSLGLLIVGGLMAGGLLLSGCGSKEMPKPYANARLEYPTSTHLTFSLPDHPCRFDYPGFFTVSEKPSGRPDTRWVDLIWPAYGATLFTTYRILPNPSSAEELAEQMEMLLTEKLPQHTTVNTSLLTLPDSTLKAYLFEVDGPTSIPLEFLITDNKHRLFQGIVQFDRTLNRDSLADILNGLTADIYRLVSSFTFTAVP